MADDPNILVMLRSFGVEIGVFCIIIIQFSQKIIYLYTVEISTTFGTSSGSSSSSNSQYIYYYINSAKTKALRKAAERGNFTVTPKILNYSPISMACISEADRFFEVKYGNSQYSTSKRYSKTASRSSKQN